LAKHFCQATCRSLRVLWQYIARDIVKPGNETPEVGQLLGLVDVGVIALGIARVPAEAQEALLVGEVPEVPQGTFPAEETLCLLLRRIDAVLVAPVGLHGRNLAGRGYDRQGQRGDEEVGECPRWQGGFLTALKDGVPAARSRYGKIFMMDIDDMNEEELDRFARKTGSFAAKKLVARNPNASLKTLQYLFDEGYDYDVYENPMF